MNKKSIRKRASQDPVVLSSPEPSTPGTVSELADKTTVTDAAVPSFQEAFMTADPNLTILLAIQVASSLGDPLELNRTFQKSTRAAVHSIGARDGVETLLAVQMVGGHNMAMKLLARAALPGQSLEGIEVCLKYANRLLQTFALQMEALKRHRSGCEQRVSVEHVHIHRGGQAIVGTINRNAGGGGGGDDQKS